MKSIRYASEGFFQRFGHCQKSSVFGSLISIGVLLVVFVPFYACLKKEAQLPGD